MTTLTEGRHAAEFILSEANGSRSRENGTLASGQNLKAGTVLMSDGAGKLTALTAVSEGGIDGAAVGILLDNVDATSAATACAYLARDAEVNLNTLTYPTESSDGGEKSETIASLALLGIITRE